MFGISSGSAIIDFCIGMSFFYLILTLVCTMVNEYLMDRLGNVRQRTLLEGISGLFYDSGKVFALFDHPLIRGLYRDEQSPTKPSGSTPGKDSLEQCAAPFANILKNLPSYIPSRTFATALIDIVAPAKDAATPQTLADIRNKIINFPSPRIKEALLPLLDAAQNDLDKARQNIEKWFDDTQDRVIGWFKRRARKCLLVVAAIVCLILNADSIMVGKMLWQNDALRATVVAQADQYIKELQKPEKTPAAPQAPKTGDLKKSPLPEKRQAPVAEKPESAAATPSLGKVPPAAAGSPPNSSPISKKVQDEVEKLKIPLGWVYKSEAGKPQDPREVPQDWCALIFKLLGLSFTTLAISFGAPFWTDLLNSFVNIRRSGPRPAKAGEEKK